MVDVELLVPTISYQPVLILIKYFFEKTNYLSQVVNCTEPSRSVRVPLIICPLKRYEFSQVSLCISGNSVIGTVVSFDFILCEKQ